MKKVKHRSIEMMAEYFQKGSSRAVNQTLVVYAFAHIHVPIAFEMVFS